MAKIRLKSLSFNSEHIRSQVLKSRFKTIEDILLSSSPVLMTDLRLSSDQVEDLISYLSAICQPKLISAIELTKDCTSRHVTFGYSRLDSLFCGGLASQTLTELTGPAGVGKTQFCLHMCLQCLLTAGLLSKDTVCYIDTESAFRPERLLEMLIGRGQTEEDALEFLEKIHIKNATTVASFNKMVQSLELFCIEESVKLLVIDSVASLIRKGFSKQDSFRRSQQLASWASMLKILASKLNIVILLTNQVTTKIKAKEIYSDGTNDFEDEFEVCPALGNSWSHFVNNRIILQYENDCRQAIIAKSAISPCLLVNYDIQKYGIHFLDHSLLLAGNPNYEIKTHPGTTIK